MCCHLAPSTSVSKYSITELLAMAVDLVICSLFCPPVFWKCNAKSIKYLFSVFNIYSFKIELAMDLRSTVPRGAEQNESHICAIYWNATLYSSPSINKSFSWSLYKKMNDSALWSFMMLHNIYASFIFHCQVLLAYKLYLKTDRVKADCEVKKYIAVCHLLLGINLRMQTDFKCRNRSIL